MLFVIDFGVGRHSFLTKNIMKYYKTLIFFVLFNWTNAQKSVKVSYEQKIYYADSFFNQLPENEREKMKISLSKPTYFELINNGDFSLFKSVNVKEEIVASKEMNTETSINKGTIIKPFKVWILKDFTKQSFVKSTYVKEQEYYVEQPFLIEELKYDKRFKVIDGYKCMSAYSVKATNDTIQYWYTQEIPIVDGPFSPTTIPGLVLSVESKKKIQYATKIEFFDKKLIVDGINKQTPFITNEDLQNKIQESRKPKSYTDEFGKKHESHSVIIKNDN